MTKQEAQQEAAKLEGAGTVETFDHDGMVVLRNQDNVKGFGTTPEAALSDFSDRKSTRLNSSHRQ